MIRFDRYLPGMQQVFSDAYKADPQFQNKIDQNIFHLVCSSSYPITHVFLSWTKTYFFPAIVDVKDDVGHAIA